MINKVINIDVDYEAMESPHSPRQTTLTTYILDGENISTCMWKKRPAVIVCPGGGYITTCRHEAEPIALKYTSAGFHSFILDYSVKPATWPAAIVELSKAIMYIREIADEYSIDKDKIFVCGFSAGGHLAASMGIHHSHSDVLKFSGAKNGENIPNGVILGYPVINMNPKMADEGSIINLTGDKKELIPSMKLDTQVSHNTAKMFIFHTFTDEMVPVNNSIYLANALEKHNIKFELHIYPSGPHGLSLANDVVANRDECNSPSVQNWIDMSIRWIKDSK